MIRRDVHDTLIIVQGTEIAFTSNKEFTQGKLTLTDLESKESHSTTYKVIKLSDGKFHTKAIGPDGEIESNSTLQSNILKPLEKNDISSINSAPNTITKESEVPSINSVPSTFAWDGIRFRGESAYGIKYSRPDVDYYKIEPWNSVSITGHKLTHYQLSQLFSNILWGLPTGAACAAIGAKIGGVPGALLGAALGIVATVFLQSIFSDDRGCVWVWVGGTTDYWRVGPHTLRNSFGTSYEYPQDYSHPSPPPGGVIPSPMML